MQGVIRKHKERKERLNRHFHRPGRTTVNQIKRLTIGFNPDGEGKNGNRCQFLIIQGIRERKSVEKKGPLFLWLAIEGKMVYTSYLPEQDILHVLEKPIMDKHVCDGNS